MSVQAGIAPLSAAQLKKLYAGKPVRVRHGDAHLVPMLPKQHKKLLKAGMKGSGMILQVPVSTMPVSPKPMMVKRQTGGNVIATSKGAAKSLITAGSDRAVQAIEGSGRTAQLFNPIHGSKVLARRIGGNVIKTSKDAAKSLITAGSDRAVQAIEGSGMKQVRAAAKQFARGEPFKLKDGTAPMSVEAIQAGRPFGGKVNRKKKFDSWFKSVGQKLLPLNKNLSPIKKAASARAADAITQYNNPEAQAQAAFDLFQREAPETIAVLKPSKAPKDKEIEPVYATVVAEEYPSSSPYPVHSKEYARQLFPVPVAYQEEELQYEPVRWFGAGVKKGSPEMKARMAHLRSMKQKAVPKAVPFLTPAPKAPKKGGAASPAKGSVAMKEKMARLRAMKKGGALYPAGY